MLPPNQNSQGERTTALEVHVADLQKGQQKISDQLDNLLALRYKGIGAFWLASALVGSGIVSLFTNFFGWFNNAGH